MQAFWHAGTTVHSLKLEATFDSPLEHLLALAAEFDLQPLWNKCAVQHGLLDRGMSCCWVPELLLRA